MKKQILLIIVVLCVNNVNAQWLPTNGTDGMNITCFATSGANIFAGYTGSTGNSGGVFRSTNNGASWVAVNNGLTNINVSSIAISGTNIFVGTYGSGLFPTGGVFLSTNNGASWEAVNNGLTNNNVSSLAISGINIFVGTTNDGVFTSTNNGASWYASSNGLPTTNFVVHSFLVNGTVVYAGTVGGVYRSIDNGATWLYIGPSSSYRTKAIAIIGTNIFAGNLLGWAISLYNNNNATWLNIDNELGGRTTSFVVNGTNLIQGSRNGVFITNNNGTSWNDISTGLPTDADVNSLAIIGNYILAGTYGSGVWKRPLSEITIGINDNLKSEFIKLYPNPTNDILTITSNDNFNSIIINNILGEVIYNSIANNHQTTIDINLSNFPKGIYFVKVSNGEKVHVEKILLH